MTLRASVDDCIALQRAADKAAGRPIDGDDGRRLENFIAVHWAYPEPTPAT
jgi:hypothetical protein